MKFYKTRIEKYSYNRWVCHLTQTESTLLLWNLSTTTLELESRPKSTWGRCISHTHFSASNNHIASPFTTSTTCENHFVSQKRPLKDRDMIVCSQLNIYIYIFPLMPFIRVIYLDYMYSLFENNLRTKFW
jgi:hypothetical protein